MADQEQLASDRAALIIARKRLSLDWLRDSFYPQWERSYANYKAEPIPKLDEDGNVDTDLTNLGSPLTFSSCRRMVARLTAQIPQFQFRSSEARSQQAPGSALQVPISEMIGTTLMFQWDRSGMQRIQKKHALQAVIFGWSPRLWYWASEIYPRRRRVNINDALKDPEILRQIEITYLKPGFFEKLWAMIQEHSQKTGEPADISPIYTVLTQLQGQYGKGNLLPVEYYYKHYEGPKSDFTFAGDCFPEPHFQSLRTCQWFCCNQLRDFSWLKKMALNYPEELGPGIGKLLEDNPRGSGRRFDSTTTRDDQELLRGMLSEIDRKTDFSTEGTLEDFEGSWLITEHHCRKGNECYIDYMEAGQNTLLGRIQYPMDLAGRFAVTDCVLIDDLVSGIGDSVARIMRGLHKVHSDQLGYRSDLILNLLRPLIGTRDVNLYENPGLVKKGHGFRMMYMRGGPDSMWQQQELAALAAAQAGLAEDQSILHQYFMFSSENAMSTMATADPASTRTAAGVNYVANQTDIVTKDYNDAFLQSCLREDAEMMWLMNRSELSDGVDFEASQYNRKMLYDTNAWKENWVRAEPEHFQYDGEISVKPGSTLAEDDIVKQMAAEKLFGMGAQFPNLLNMQKARDEVLITSGHRHDLPDWIPPPQPEPPLKMNLSMSASAKWEELTPGEKSVWMEKAQLIPEEPEPGTPGAGGPGGPGGPGGGPAGLPPGLPPDLLPAPEIAGNANQSITPE